MIQALPKMSIVLSVICISIAAVSFAQEHPSNSGSKEKLVTAHAKGSFDVKVTPDPSATRDSVPSRMLIDKQFHGDIEGTSKGQMLTAGDFTKGSAGYVAIEEVTGTVAGRAGSFALQHSATMTPGAQELNIKVVPGSPAGQLTGLAGTMKIEIKDGKHFYDFEYSLPVAH